MFADVQSSDEVEVASVGELKTKLEELSLPELVEIDGIGEKVAQSIFDWIGAPESKRLLEKFDRHEIRLMAENKEISDHLKGMTFVVTGTLPTLSRDEAKAVLKKHGAKLQALSARRQTMYWLGLSQEASMKQLKGLGLK